MGNYCTSEDSQTFGSSVDFRSSYMRNSSGVMSINTHEMKHAAMHSFNDSIEGSRVQVQSPQNIQKYQSFVLKPTNNGTNAPPKSMIALRMNSINKVALSALNNFSQKSNLKAEIKQWQGVYRYEFHGPVCYDDGSTYKGQFVRGQKCGFGEMVYVDGSCYIGIWKNDLRNGKGVFCFNNGDIHFGNFNDDLACGLGKYFISLLFFRQVYEEKWRLLQRNISK